MKNHGEIINKIKDIFIQMNKGVVSIEEINQIFKNTRIFIKRNG